ncbi:hypothetical protein NC653_001110 [Populus alba x Populus x berolinensis]|uniref:Retrotransposon gag domain-containing protein n=2 Tax=Populus TaxID=3689 RepID=A0A4V6A745_POPAL|nr:hypothetical protein NC653_001110 [Populus alba x Populus x berolinensis]TKR97555.1 hypothetical protein D5086_0000212000 [Populus alba]
MAPFNSLLKPSLPLMVLQFPTFANWETQDNLILTCIDSSLSDEVLAQITHYSTSTEVWIALSTAFASESRAKAIQVHSQLSTLWKGSQTISDYFMTIKCLIDKLNITGQLFMCDDIITYLLIDLGSEYDSLVSKVTHHDTSFTLEGVYFMLLMCEACTQHNNQTLSLSPALANIATRQQPFTGGRGIHQLPEARVWSIQWQSWRWSWLNAKYPPPFLRAYEDVVTPNIIESLGVCAGIYPFNFRVMVPLWVSLQYSSS